MSTRLKSVVFKTNNLKRIMDFYIRKMGLRLSESSPHHFVIHDGNIRVLFIHHADEPATELYFSDTQHASAMDVMTEIHHEMHDRTDPNGIHIIITGNRTD